MATTTKQPKRYMITCTLGGLAIHESGNQPMTLAEYLEFYQYKLEKGKFAEHFMGNRKINTQPKSMRGLITNLRNSDNNTAPSGYAGTDYTFAEVI